MSSATFFLSGSKHGNTLKTPQNFSREKVNNSGGRRTNKQTYCGLHNNHFGTPASIIAQRLKPINVLLAVRPD